MNPTWREQLDNDGYAQLSAVFDAPTVEAIADELAGSLQADGGGDAALRSETGVVYAARNVLQVWPRVAAVWQTAPLPDMLTSVLGPDFGLVRALFFDKPPGHSWALPCHKDLTIAVRNNRLRCDRFVKPTRKAGVPHVEAPLDVLERMLTVRVHLDAVTDDNGPLKVLPGSHRGGKALTVESVTPSTLHAARGDVLLMRPLLAHWSGKSMPDTASNRRVLHLEFAATAELGDGYEWHDFVAYRVPA